MLCSYELKCIISTSTVESLGLTDLNCKLEMPLKQNLTVNRTRLRGLPESGIYRDISDRTGFW